MSGRKSRRIRGAGITSAIQSIAEALERRVLLSTVSWTGGGDGMNWSNPSNWSGGKVPADGDDVALTLAGQTTPIQIDTNVTIGSLVATDPLTMSANSLTLDGTGKVQASSASNFAITGGSITVKGNNLTFADSASDAISDTSLVAQDGAVETFSSTSLTRVNLDAEAGGMLLFPAAQGYSVNSGNGYAIQANGTGSTIDLSHLISMGGSSFNTLAVSASTGGSVSLAGAITGSTTLTVADGISGMNVAGVSSL